MKTIAAIILSVMILAFVSCGKMSSPSASLNTIKNASCSGDYETLLSAIDVDEFIIFTYKNGDPQATPEDIQKFKTTEKFKENTVKFKDHLKQMAAKKNEGDFCKILMISVKEDLNEAQALVQENPDNPYLKFNWNFSKKEKGWLLTSVSNPVGYPVELSFSDLINEYNINSIAADEKYKSKPLTVTGTIEGISKDIFGKAFVLVGSGPLNNVQCYISEPQIKKLASLQKRNNISITGICQGKTITITMKECVIN